LERWVTLSATVPPLSRCPDTVLLLHKNVVGNCSVKSRPPMETFTMSRKELPRAGHVAAQRFAGRRRSATPSGRGRARTTLPAAVAARVQALPRPRYRGFNDTHLTEKLREVHGWRYRASRCGDYAAASACPRASPAAGPAWQPPAPRAAAGQLLQLDGSVLSKRAA